MTVTYQTVTIGSKTYDSYADLTTADDYLNADQSADAWRAADEDSKGRALITAVRVLNLQTWLGAKTYPDDDLAWPRTGVVVNGETVDPDIIPQAIIDASIALANDSMNGVDIANFTSTAATQRRFKAGSVEIENFRMVGGAFAGYPLPKTAWLLISPYTGSTGGMVGARSNGTCGRSILDHPFNHNAGI